MASIIEFINVINDNIEVSFQKIGNFIDGVYLFFIIFLIYILILLFILMFVGINWLFIQGFKKYKENEKIILKYVKFAKID
jgi:ABC-type proline/glycine betaine transport system permease subunit